MKPKFLLSLTVAAAAIMSLSACDPFGTRTRQPDPEPVPPAEVQGWSPIYSTSTSADTIRSLEPRSIEKGGKIYVKGDTLYQVEAGKGIHVIELKQPSNPQKVAFINVLGAQEIAIKNNVLYTNNLNDLVVLDITDVRDVKLLDRITGVFHMVDPQYPPGTGYYECVNASKGKVVGWEQKTIKYPQCRK